MSFAGPGDAGNYRQDAKRNVDVNVLQVVAASAANGQNAFVPAERRLERKPVAQVAASQGVAGAQAIEVTLVDDLPTLRAGSRAKVHNVVGDSDAAMARVERQTQARLSRRRQSRLAFHKPCEFCDLDNGGPCLRIADHEMPQGRRSEVAEKNVRDFIDLRSMRVWGGIVQGHSRS